MKQIILEKITKDQTLRKALAKESFYYFFHIYFGEHITYDTAPFQKEIINLAENYDEKMVVVVSFRGSSKSTLISLAYAIWSVIGVQNLKFVLLISQVQNQSRQLLANIKKEFETNELLRKDFETFEDATDDWRATSLVLPKYKAKIMAASTGESIRGYRFGPNRPQLIIFDDIEDNNSVRTKESRDKTYDFVTGDAIPAGDTKTKVMVIGNLLHQDSVIMRFRQEIETGVRTGLFRSYPVVDKRGRSLWLSKYPDKKAIEKLKRSVGNERMYRQEYLLEIVPADDQIIERSWIKYYDELPTHRTDFRFIAIGVDLAISEKDSADYTAFVVALVYGYDENLQIYILPNPVNKRLSFSLTETEMVNLVETLGGKDKVRIYIESNGYQQAFAEILKNKDYLAEAVNVNSASKRERLNFVSGLVRNGQVLFPKTGAEDLLDQIVGLGIEKHDDLADAFSILLKKVREEARDDRIEIVKMEMSIVDSMFKSITSKDWADEEDEEMLRKLNFSNY